MLPTERHLKIIELISKNGSVQVEELAKVLNVSHMTIRRDLEKLKQDGRIDRCHGGAIIKREVPYTEKRVLETDVKQKIATPCFPEAKRILVGSYLLVNTIPLHRTEAATDPKTQQKVYDSRYSTT